MDVVITWPLSSEVLSDVRPQLPDYQLTAKPLLSSDALQEASFRRAERSSCVLHLTVFNWPHSASGNQRGKSCLEALGHPQS